MTTENLAGLRKNIAKKFCRTILWIDDEIRLDTNDDKLRKRYMEFFMPKAKEFADEGIICQLKGFPPIAPGHDPYADSDADSDEISDEKKICKTLAKQADIVILDWFLGDGSTTTHAMEIIEDQITTGGTRFIVILSQEPHLEEQFEKAYVRGGDSFKKDPTTNWYSNSKGLFILLLHKNEFKQKSGGKTLVTQIYEQLSTAYPDYLHWAAIEISSRIKEFAPKWLSSLPENTDLGVLTEQKFSEEEISLTIFENLLEDLKETISYSDVESLKKENMKVENWFGYSRLREDFFNQKGKSSPSQKQEWGNAEKLVLHADISDSEIAPFRKGLDKTLKNIESSLGKIEPISQFLSEIRQLGEFCEIKSQKHSITTPIKRGLVIRKKDDDAKIWVCISESCDCLRANSLLFISGEQSSTITKKTGKPGDTYLIFEKKEYVFRPEASCLQPFTVNGVADSRQLSDVSVEKRGFIREGILSRLISRYWSHVTRVGVGQPLLLRNLRTERS